MNFTVFPPEVNSARVYGGAGLGPVLAAATAWSNLAMELHSAAGEFGSVTAELAAAPWQGPASAAMAQAAGAFVAWLTTLETQAEHTAGQALLAADTFENALTATVHPGFVAANRTALQALAAVNLFGQNATAIAATEAAYEQMWAQDVAAMADYHAAASTIAAQLTSWQRTLPGLPSPVQSAIANVGLSRDRFGYGNSGRFDLGVGNTGNFNIGVGNTGSGNIGFWNTGSSNIGFWNTGNGNLGSFNTGNGNFGIANAGNGNIGYLNAGSWNIGLANTGDGNIGLGNPGDGNFGALLTYQNQVGVSGLNTTVLIMGGTGINPIPSPEHVARIEQLFVTPQYPGYNSAFLVTPAQLYPLTGLHSLTFDASVNQGVTALNNQIMAQLSTGNHVVVVGYSQSATVATLEQRYLMTLPASQQPTPDQLSFMLLGNPNRPNGGFLERLVGAQIDQIGFTFFGANPYSPYPTIDYALQYDGVSDFPQYVLNPISSANAIAGMVFVHPTHSAQTPSQIASGVVQPVSPSNPEATYILIPTTDLPLLDPLRMIPGIGNPLAALLQPDARILVDLGYDRSAYQDLPTPFSLGVAPPNTDWAAVANELQQGAIQGVRDAKLAAALPPPFGMGLTLH